MVSWVGFELLHSSYQLGMSERRAAWFVKWTRTTAEQETVHMAKFEDCLGRVTHVTGALELERPFMAGRPNRGVTTLAQCRPFRRRQPREWTRRRRQSGQGSEAGFPQCDQTARWTCGRRGGSVWS